MSSLCCNDCAIDVLVLPLHDMSLELELILSTSRSRSMSWGKKKHEISKCHVLAYAIQPAILQASTNTTRMNVLYLPEYGAHLGIMRNQV